jgi:hypothetical protein
MERLGLYIKLLIQTLDKLSQLKSLSKNIKIGMTV